MDNSKYTGYVKKGVNETVKDATITVSSLRYIFKGILYIIQNRWTLRYIFLTVIVHMLAFGCGFIGFIVLITAIINDIPAIQDLNDPTLKNALNYIISTSGGIIGGLIFLFLMSSVINTTIYARMSGKMVMKSLGINVRIPFWADFRSSLEFEVKILLLRLFFSIITIVLNLIPVIGSALYVIANTLLIVITSGLNNFQPVLSTKTISFRNKIRLILTRPYHLWTFLFITGSATSIPLINALTIPWAIVSSTLIFQDVINHKDIPDRVFKESQWDPENLVKKYIKK